MMVVMDRRYEETLLFDFYGDLLTEHQKRIYEDVVFGDLSCAEAADTYGITRQGVRDSIVRTERQLFSFEEKLGLLSRFRELEAGLDDIAQTARTIAAQSDNNELTSLAQSIIRRVGELKDNE